MNDIVPLSTSCANFEDFKNQNGITFWWASELMLMLGYKDSKSFKKAIDRATKACISVGINHYDNIVPYNREYNGEIRPDFKLTRFACYMTVMNADPKIPEVAIAQVYFAEQTRKFELYVQGQNEMERIIIRDETKEGNKALMSAAKNAGVEDFAKFNNAGYLGMYNMMNYQLANKRGVEKEKLFDYMGRTELAANLFRITQTEERIKSKNIHGQAELESTHYNVGREVRKIVEENTGKAPEALIMERQLPEIQKEIKSTCKKMEKIDKPSKKKQ